MSRKSFERSAFLINKHVWAVYLTTILPFMKPESSV